MFTLLVVAFLVMFIGGIMLVARNAKAASVGERIIESSEQDIDDYNRRKVVEECFPVVGESEAEMARRSQSPECLKAIGEQMRFYNQMQERKRQMRGK
jgi:hypothetical protein